MPGFEFPHCDLAIGGAGNHAFAIGGSRQASHGALVGSKRAKTVATFEFPHCERAVVGAGNYVLAVGGDY